MIELFRDPEMARVGQYKCILEAEGIPAFIRNENVSVTEVSLPMFYPALCVVHDGDYSRAVEIIRTYERASSDPGAEIACPQCEELSPGTFAACWNCDADLPCPDAGAP